MLLFAAVVTAVYTFFLLTGTPVTETAAITTLRANSVLRGEIPVLQWGRNILELPVYLLCIRIFGPAPFAAIAANTLLYTLLFLTGLLLLERCGAFSLPTLLLYFVLAGMPNAEWLSMLQENAGIWIAFLLLLSAVPGLCRSPRSRSGWGLLTLSLFLLLRNFHLPAFEHPNFLRALITLQKAFRADFSNQPLLTFRTAQFILYSLLLAAFPVLIITALRHPGPSRITGGAAAGLLLLSLFTGSAVFPCGLPILAAVLASQLYSNTGLRTIRLAEHRLPLRLILSAFLVICLLSALQPVALSRVPTPEDEIAAGMIRQGVTALSSDSPDAAQIALASKGKIIYQTE